GRGSVVARPCGLIAATAPQEPRLGWVSAQDLGSGELVASRCQIDAEDDDPRECRPIHLSRVAARGQCAYAAGDAAGVPRLARPADRVVRLDAQLVSGNAGAVEAEPAWAVEAASANENPTPIARSDVPEHLFALPLAAE